MKQRTGRSCRCCSGNKQGHEGEERETSWSICLGACIYQHNENIKKGTGHRGQDNKILSQDPLKYTLHSSLSTLHSPLSTLSHHVSKPAYRQSYTHLLTVDFTVNFDSQPRPTTNLSPRTPKDYARLLPRLHLRRNSLHPSAYNSRST